MTNKKNLLTVLSIVLTIFLLGCGGGGGGSATIPSVTSITYSGASQVKTYSSGAQQSFDPVSSATAWASDHITKTTTYTYSDGATNRVVSTVSPTLGTPTYAAGVQSIVTTYGDGTTATATNNSISAPVTWATDHVTKTTTYTFANGGTNPVVTTVAGVVGTPTYAAGVQTIVTTYGDGTTSTATNNSISAPVTWASDHVTKTTTYTFANGGTNPVVTTVAGVVGTPTYAAGVQTIVTTYGDGTTAMATNNSISAPVTWASDHVTKTTTYTFANGGTNPVVTTVAGVAGTPTYAAGVQTIVTTYGDGTTATATNNSTSAPVTWATDHVTKTTTYTFANGGTNPVVTTVAGVVGTPTYAAGVQTIVTTYGDGTTSTATNNSISAPVTWASDHVTKTTTYTFANGGTNPVVTTVAGVAGTPTYAAGVQTIVTTYGDGTTATATNNSTSAPVTWASDHVTKTTTYTFANGGTNPVVTTVAGVAGTPTYAAGVQTIVTTYGDGTTATATNNSISAPVTWASDHVTKTTTYTFANGGTNPVVTSVAGVAGTPTYAAGVQTIVTTYGDGTTATATNNSISAPVTWASDHVTKTTTYTFANGGTNPVVATVAGTLSTPALTPAVYPANWTTTGTVTGPSVSSLATTYGDGYVSTAQDGTSSLPFLQTTLAALPTPITDPNANVQSSSTNYNQRWGTPDERGPAISASFSDGAVNSITLTGPLTQWGQTVSGQCPLGPFVGFCLNGPTIGTPHPDVLKAWRNGWTGNGVNVVIEDWLTEAHGAVTTILTNRYAIASTIYGFNVPSNLGMYNQDGTSAAPTSNVAVGVVNASWGGNLPGLIGHAAPWTNSELAAAAVTFNNSALRSVNRLTGVTVINNFNLTDAVIVKAAGNDALSADKDPLVKALADNSSINSRLLVVGALTMAGFTSAKVSLASSYSNFAGTYSPVATRFLVASGTTPFSSGDIALNGVPIGATTSVDPNGVNLGAVGTSYAAPRVSGYVAILRQKFPNLDAIKSSSVMLDTARYDTLTCYPNCDPAIYGRGEASLSRALAPVGYLR